MTADQLFRAIQEESRERGEPDIKLRTPAQEDVLQMLRRIVARAQRYEAQGAMLDQE